MTAVWHVAWKEYRLLRGLWLAMYLIAALLQTGVVLFSSGGAVQVATLALTVAVWLPAFHALGCGATMFAAEKDDGTFDFLRALPVHWSPLLAGKVLYAIASSVALFAALSILPRLLTRGASPDENVVRLAWGIWGVAALEALAWGMFCSLFSSRPLKATVIAAALGSTVTHTLVASTSGSIETLEAYTKAIPYRLLLAAGLLAVDAALARRWLDPHPRAGGFRWRSWTWVREAPRPAPAIHFGLRTGLGRLVWQELRYSGQTVAAYLVVILALVVVPAIVRPASDYPTFLTSLIGASCIASALLGASTFRGDQEQRRFRFLAQHAVSARSLWLGRQCFWGGLSLAFGVAAFSAALLIAASRTSPAPAADAVERGMAQFIAAPQLGTVLMLLVLTFASGQLASLLLRSPLLSGTLGLASGAALLGWLAFAERLGMAWWWSAAPLAVAMFAATWLRAPDWLLERNTLVGWLRVAAVLCVPFIAVTALAIGFRVYEVPGEINGVSLAGGPFDVTEYTAPRTPNEAETAEIYNQAVINLRTNGEEALRLMLKATARSSCVFHEPGRRGVFDAPDAASEYNRLAALLFDSASDLEAQGDLDTALSRYLAAYRFAQHLAAKGNFLQCVSATNIQAETDARIAAWAKLPGQTPERLRGALDAWRDARGTEPLWTNAIKTSYIQWREVIEGDEDRIAGLRQQATNIGNLSLARTLFPWEKARALRLLDLTAYWNLHGKMLRLDSRSMSSAWDWFRAQRRSGNVEQYLKDLAATTPYPSSDAFGIGIRPTPDEPSRLAAEQAFQEAIAALENQ